MTNIFVTRIAKNGDTKLNIRAHNFLAFSQVIELKINDDFSDTLWLIINEYANSSQNILLKCGGV